MSGPVFLKLTFTRIAQIVVLIIIFSGPVMASSPVVIDRSLSMKRLAPNLEYFRDDSGSLEYKDVSGESFLAKFRPVGGEDPSFGYSHAAYWFRFAAVNPDSRARIWYLECDYPMIDVVELYVPSRTGHFSIKGGDAFPFNHRPVRYRNVVFPVNLPPGETVFYLRVKSEGTLLFPLLAMSQDYFSELLEWEGLFLWLHTGILLALALYNAFIFFSLREKNYIILSLFIFSMGIYSMVNTGLAYQYLWPGLPRWAGMSQPVFLFLSMFFCILFSRSFLGLRERNIRLDIVLRVAAALQVIGIISVFFIDYYHIIQISAAMVPVLALLVIFSGVNTLLKGFREARIYLAAWSGFMLLATLVPLRSFGLVPQSFLTQWGYMFGLALLVLLFSLGVADKINFMRRERDHADAERETALKSLRESEEKYRTLVENAFEGILLLVDEKVFYANRALMEMTGYTAKEFYGFDFFNDIFPDTPKGRALIKKNYDDRMAGREAPQKYEAQVRRKSGEIIDVIISAAVIEIEGKKGSLSIITDITSQKKAEATILKQYTEIQAQYAEMEALNEEICTTQDELLEANDRIKREKEQLLSTLRSIGDAVVTLDREHRVVLMNRVAEELLHYTAEEAAGKNISEVVLMKNSDGYLVDPSSDIFTGDGRSSLTLTMMTRDGAERAVEINGSPMAARGADGGMVLAIRDITERIKVEHELSKISKIESIGVLAGGIAHDFNNILTAILGNASLAAQKAGVDEELMEILASIESAGERATSLTHQLLTFAKGGEPVKRATSIVDLLQESANFVLAGSRVKCEMIIDKTVPPIDIDANQISHALNNLFINAMQAMPDGGVITVRIEEIDEAPPDARIGKGGCVKISIKDTGPGIPHDMLDKIFDPYFTTKKTGSGLGLTSAFSIIKRHGGHLDILSVHGKGCTAVVYLKTSAHEVVREKPASPAAVKRSEKILVMDDEDDVRKVISVMLKHLGYAVTECAAGRDAVEMYREHLARGEGFDAVIMDLTVPGGMGGKVAVQKIREMDEKAVVIVSSGYSNDPVMSNFRAHGFSGVLVKPFTLQEISRVLEEVLSKP